MEVTDEDLLTFAVWVREELPYTTELCALTSVEVEQSSTSLYSGAVSITPVELRPGFVQVATETPIATANPSAAAELSAVEGAFGRPSCD